MDVRVLLLPIKGGGPAAQRRGRGCPRRPDRDTAGARHTTASRGGPEYLGYARRADPGAPTGGRARPPGEQQRRAASDGRRGPAGRPVPRAPADTAGRRRPGPAVAAPPPAAPSSRRSRPPARLLLRHLDSALVVDRHAGEELPVEGGAGQRLERGHVAAHVHAAAHQGGAQVCSSSQGHRRAVRDTLGVCGPPEKMCMPTTPQEDDGAGEQQAQRDPRGRTTHTTRSSWSLRQGDPPCLHLDLQCDGPRRVPDARVTSRTTVRPCGCLADVWAWRGRVRGDLTAQRPT